MKNLPNQTSFSIAQASKLIGVHPKTLRRWEDGGKFTAQRTLGGQRRYTSKDIKGLNSIKQTGVSTQSPPSAILLNINQVANQLKVSPTTIRRWVREDKLHPIKNSIDETLFSSDHIKDIQLPQTAKINTQPEPRSITLPPTPPQSINLPSWLKSSDSQKTFIYSTLVAIFLTFGLTLQALFTNTKFIDSPSIEQLDLPKGDIQVAMPSVGNFLNGQIAIGSDTGTLSFIDQNGNIYSKNSALIEGNLTTSSLLLIPTSSPPGQIGQQYVDKDTGNLMYFDGSDWTQLNSNSLSASSSSGLTFQGLYNSGFTTTIADQQDIDLSLGNIDDASSSASLLVRLVNPGNKFSILGGASQELITFQDQALYPILISQPTKILGNLYSPKFVDTESDSYYLDPSNTDLSLSVAGNATISGTLTFSKYGEYLTNSIDNYLVFSGGFGVGGDTEYGFNTDGDVKGKSGSISDTLTINGTLDANGSVDLGDGGDGITLNGSSINLTGSSVGVDNTSPSYQLDVNGTIRGYGITDSSDIRLKENIADLSSSSSLNQILSLQGVKYNWIDTDTYGQDDQLGFIAQEVELIVPEVVKTDNNGYKSIAYGKITAVIVEAIKELDNKISLAIEESSSIKPKFLSPSIETERLATNFISPLTSDGQITVQANLMVEGKIEAEVVTADIVNAKELVAENIESKTIDSIRQKIQDLSDTFQVNTATASPQIANLDTSLIDSLTQPLPASNSGYLDISSINADVGFFSEYLAVLGTATITDLKVTQSINLDDQLILSGNSISSLTQTLYLQPSGVGAINFLAGTMTLDETGQVTINGNLKIAGDLETQNASISGTLIASNIESPLNQNLNISIASHSALTVYSQINQLDPVASINASGSATFNSLNLDNSGTATVSAGLNQVTVSASNIKDKSQVIVTFNSDYAPATKYWINKREDLQQFTLLLNYPVNHDTLFDWAIIN